MAMNLVVLQGNLTKDAEIIETSKGTKIVRYSIAVNRGTKGADGKSVADFFNVTALGGKNGLSEGQVNFFNTYLKKGQQVIVRAQIHNNNYESKKHPGETVYGFEFLQDSVDLAGNKGGGNAAPAADSAADAPADFVDVPEGTDEALPFV